MLDTLVFLGSGKLLQVFAKRFPPIQAVCENGELLAKLYGCNLCSGFWVYLFLAPFFKINMQIENKLVRYLVTACISSLLTYLVGLGWDEEFGKLVIEDATG